jgi:hypothetical protein
LDTKIKKIVSRQKIGDGIIDLKESVKGRGAFMPTASLFFPAKLINDKISWFDSRLPLADFFIQMILSYSGKIYYIDEPMCVYRRNAPGSWTERHKKSEQAREYSCAMIEGIIYFYNLLGDKRRRYYLAYPFFFYSANCYYDIKKPMSSFAKLLGLNQIKQGFLLFNILYLFQLMKHPLRLVLRKVQKALSKK